jgi:hypothetical protein
MAYLSEEESASNPHNPQNPPANVPPLTNNHFLLPLPGARYAPRTLTFKGGRQELTHFLEVYNHVCAHFSITDSSEKCKGITPYCTSKVARMIARLPSYIDGNYRDLIKDLYYFLEDEDDSYDIGKVGSFTRKWRKRKVESMTQFKRYHRKYLELVGKARGAHKMTDEDFNRYFWEGIHYTLRQRIEDRMTVADPFLDVSTPFNMNEVVKAIGHLFNKKRFDQHLRKRASYDSSESESEEDSHKTKKPILSDSEEEDDKYSDDTDNPKKPLIKKKGHSTAQKPAVKKDYNTKKTEDDEISRLVHELGRLSLNDPMYSGKYQALYIDIIRKDPSLKDILDKPRSRSFRGPPGPNDLPQRDPPPHRPYGPPQRQFPNPNDLFCYGCGQGGHQMMQCGELNSILNQGTVVRNNLGKLQWPDGSQIHKERGESWVQAIGKAVKRTNLVRAELNHLDDDTVYQYVGITRDEGDASSDDQEELGWSSGSIGDCYALGAERNARVSRDARKKVQFNTPSSAQGMKKFPERKEAIGPGRQNPPISNSINPHSHQHGAPKRISPLDVNQHKFEGTNDHQLLPMDIDQGVMEKPGNKPGKVPTNNSRSEVIKVSNPRPKSGRSSSEIVQDIMKMPLTVTLGEAVNISPILRRDLTAASRQQHEVLPQASERKEKAEKTVLGSSVSKSYRASDNRLGEPRDELLKVPAKVGRAKMMGVFDSGSQINVLSDKWAKRCGLPVSTDGIERYRITGVNGGIARCVGIIPNAKIYVTHNKLPTRGELVVVEHSGFDLLLGRPWGTANAAGMREAIEGTYLNFMSKGKEYEVNVAPNPRYEQMFSGVGAALRIGNDSDEYAGESESDSGSVSEIGRIGERYSDRDDASAITRVGDDDYKSVYALAAGKRVSLDNVSDSEPEENVPELIPQDTRYNSEWSRGQYPEEERGNRSTGYDDEPVAETSRESDEEDSEGYLSFNPQGSRQFKEGQRKGKNTSMLIETELHESYIQMVQKGANEEEWSRFCEAEKKRIKKDRKLWNEWKEEGTAVDAPTNNAMENEVQSPDPPEPSATLATPEPDQQPQSPGPPLPNEPVRASAITAARRSRRVKHESQRARESEDWQKWRKKVYEREEKLTRQTVTNRNCAASEKVMSSFGARFSMIGRGNKKPRQTKGQKKGKEAAGQADRTHLKRDPVVILRNHGYRPDPKKFKKLDIDDVMDGKHDPRGIWPSSMGQIDEPMDQGGAAESQQPREQRTRYGSSAPDVRAEEEEPDDQAYDDTNEYSWISREEIEIILEWLDDVPRSRGKRFLVHAADNDAIAVTMIPGFSQTGAWRITDPGSQQVLELRKGFKGVLTRIEKHTMECAEKAQRSNQTNCGCSRAASATLITYQTGQPGVLNPIRIGSNPRSARDDPSGPRPTSANPAYLVYAATAALNERNDGTLYDQISNPGAHQSDDSEPGPEEEMERPGNEGQNGEEEPDANIGDSPEKGNGWELDRRRYEEKVYRVGNSEYRVRNKAKPVSEWEEVPIIRPFEESPEWDIVLGQDGTYCEDEAYPVIGREEIKAAINWIDNLPENRLGGKHFLIHKTDNGSIAFTLTRDDHTEGPSAQVGKIALTLTRGVNLPEIVRIERNSVEDRSDRNNDGEEPESSNLPEDNSEWESVPESDDDPEESETDEAYLIPATLEESEEVEVGAENPDRIQYCAAAACERDQGPETRPEGSVSIMEKGKDRNEGPGMTHPGDSLDEPNREKNPENNRRKPDLSAVREVNRLFPGEDIVRLLPPPAKSTNGLLAAREVTPFARYGDREEYEFYAKGVTLAMDNENKEATYYRGNALIRITDREVPQGPKLPTRQWVEYFRRRLFRADRLAKEKEKEGVENPPDPNKFEHRGDAPPDRTTGINKESPPGQPKKGEMTRDEIAAVVADLMKHPIGNLEGKRVYEIQRTDTGRVLVTPMPLDFGEWKTDGSNPETKTIVSNEPTLADHRINDRVALTQLGSDPQASDHWSLRADAAWRTETMDWSAAPWNSTELNRPQSWQELYDKLDYREKQIIEDRETIKQTRETHQEESQNTPLSNPATLLPHNPDLETWQLNQPPPSSSLDRTRSDFKDISSMAARKIDYLTAPKARPSTIRHDSEVLILPPPPSRPRPGIVAATHLAELKEESTPQEPCFFGYGATVVLVDDAGVKQTYKGHALIHLYPSAHPNTRNFPPPPSRRRSEAARCLLLKQNQVPEGLTESILASRSTNLWEPVTPLTNFRFDDPSPPETKPPVVHNAEDTANDPTHKVEVVDEAGRDLSAAEALVKLRNLKDEISSSNEKTEVRDKPHTTSGTIRALLTDHNAVTHTSPAPPRIREGIRFVSGGFLPGTGGPADPDPLAGTNLDDDRRIRAFHEPEAPVDPKAKGQISQKPNTTHPARDHARDHPVRDGAADVEMDIATTGQETTGPPPNLSYPPTDEPSLEGKTDSAKESSDAIAVDPPTSQSAKTDDGGDQAGDPATNQSSGVDVEFQTWKKSIEELRRRLRDGSQWTDLDIQEIFGSLGLLQWWYDIRREDEAGKVPDWEYWRKRIVTEWRKRYPNVAPEHFEAVTEKVHDQEALAVTTHSLAVKLREPEDVEMESVDVPRTPNPSPYLPPVRFQPNKPSPANGGYRYPLVPDTDEIGELKSRIAELEDQFGEAEVELRRSLNRLREEVVEDGATLADLRWRVTEIEDLEKRGPKKGKRSYRKAKAKARTPTHRYPTRLSTAQAEDVLQLGQKEYGDLDGRMKALEERMVVNKEEIERLEAELVHAEELSPKIDALTRCLEGFRTTQLKINIGVIQEFARLRSFYATIVEPKVSSHSTEIAGLKARYNMLHALAATLYSNQQGSDPPMHSLHRVNNSARSVPPAPFNQFAPPFTHIRKVPAV